jgi:hypothetical protein
MHFSRPLYEGLPWLYIALGVGGIAVSYFVAESGSLAVFTGMAGVAAVLAGVVILLRRRDFRELGRRYAGRDADRPDRQEGPGSDGGQD